MDYIEIIQKTITEFDKYSVVTREQDGYQATISHPNKVQYVVKALKKSSDLKFTHLVDITAVDYYQELKRFEVVTHLLSMEKNIRIRLKLKIKEDENATSISNLFANATWFEREVYDMFGIKFDGLEDHRRILTDYNFEGTEQYPLKKDFATSGYEEVYYDNVEGKIKYKETNLVQASRVYDFEMPWQVIQDKIKESED